MGIKHVVGITVGAAGLLMAGCGWAGTSTFDDQETIDETITEVRFTNDSGDVKIEAGDTTEVRRAVRHGEDKPGRTYRVDDGVLILEPCPVRNCKIDYELTVPADVKVNGHVDSGHVEVAGVETVNVEAESGDLTVRDVAGQVNAAVQSGQIDLTGIGGAVVAGAESGNVTVNLVAPKSVSVQTQSGNVEVTVPSGKYHVTTSVESGSVDNELDDDPSGLPIEVSAESGNVTIGVA